MIYILASLIIICGYLPAEKEPSGEPVHIGSRLELFVDTLLVAELNGVEFRLHSPVKLPLPETSLTGHYMTVIKDGNIYKGYYRSVAPEYSGPTRDGHPGEITCYAESRDGHEWTMPDLGLYEVPGLRSNNVILTQNQPFSHNFCPFFDTRPGVPENERYKALAGTRGSGLHAFVSADGIHWEKTGPDPVIEFPEERFRWGGFDSQNVSFWSEPEQLYVCYCRTKDTPYGNLRSISRTTSPDFRNWTELVPTHPNLPEEHLYTSNTHPYFRAPHIYIALPTRFILGRLGDRSVSGNIGSTDILFMTTRAGTTSYDRLFTEAFIRPGLDPASWGNRANYVALNVVPTGPGEMSVYHRNGHRYILRTDGFISVRAGAGEGELLTKPMIFSGTSLLINYSTAAAGRIQVEIQDQLGLPVKGFHLEDCLQIVGDEIEREVKWTGSPSLGELAGLPVRLRFVMKECDLYSFRFRH